MSAEYIVQVWAAMRLYAYAESTNYKRWQMYILTFELITRLLDVEDC